MFRETLIAIAMGLGLHAGLIYASECGGTAKYFQPGDEACTIELYKVKSSKLFPHQLLNNGTNKFLILAFIHILGGAKACLLYTSPSPRD